MTDLTNVKEEAIPLLIFDPIKKIFTLTEQGEELIRSIKGEFAVISVAGMYRTGKSYLLNQMLLNRSKGFSVGPTVNPCTKGLWMWSKPIMGLDSQVSSKVPILLIDTEGFGAFDEDQNHDIKIFTLSVLLSSYFIYNSMGSIDENAIQSLSFVINLSKNIQLKGKYENDPEELAALFPSFLWLVRDFSLQLVDDDGDTITPKEYLEKVLDTAKSTYDMDDKTKIRKLIKTFFKDRDCHTMVRPITDESKLQDLQNIPPEKLRPDFMEGIIQLRRKIASKIKPKSLNKKPLVGDMYINMIKSFIEAINKGAVPNIENTWSSMCKVECQKAFELAEMMYESYLKENLGESISLGGSINTSEFIQGVHKVAKENAVSIFRKKALGDDIDEYLKQLKTLFKEKLKQYEEQAEEANKKEMYKKLKQFYAYFENKVYNPKSTEDEITVEKIDEELKKMEYKINERFGDFNLKNELFNEFKANVFFFVGSYLKNNSNMQAEQLTKEKEELNKKLAEEVEEHKQNYLKELKKKSSLIETMKTELLEQKETNSNLKHKLLSVEKDLDIAEKNFADKSMKQKDDQERKFAELQKTLITQDEKVREAERKVIQIENEKSKEIALLEQKNNHLAKQIEDLKKNEKDSGVELKSQLKEATNALKESTNKYELKIKTITQQLDFFKEQLVDSEANFKKSETLLEAEKEKNTDLEKKIKSDKDENESKIAQLKKKLESERAKFAEEFAQKEKDLILNYEKLKLSYEELELKFKSVEDDLKNQISTLKRENSVLNQNYGFLEEKNKDLISQLEEQKKNHDAIVSRLESKTFSMIGNEEYNKKLDEIKSFYEKEKMQSEETFDNQKRLYVKQIDQLNESKNELEIRMRAEIDDREKKLNETQSKLDKALKDIKGLTTEKKLLSDNLHETNEEMNEKLKSMLKESEKRLEDKDFEFHKEREEFAQKSEETIKQLKMIYETEKIRMEDKLKEEKAKADKKIKQLTNEYEEKLRELTEEAQNEYATLEEEYKNLEQRSLNYESQAENEINLLNHKCETFEKSTKELKEALNVAVTNAQKAADLAVEKYEKERKELHEKVENLIQELNSKEKEVILIKSEKDRLESVIKDKDEYVFKLRQEVEDEKKELQQRIEDYNRRYHEGNDKFLQEKMEFTKDVAVIKQQLEFSKKKCEELQEQLEHNQIRYEEKLFSLRAEVEADSHERLEKLRKEKEEVEEKLMNKKKDMKEAEQTLVKQINSYERDIVMLREKLNSVENSKKEMQENYEKEIQGLSAFSKNIKGDYQKEIEDYLKNSEGLKQRVQTLNTELMEARNTIEKDKMLWENKFKFLENQRDTYKFELNESQKKFDLTIDTLQKKLTEEKDKVEKSLSEKIVQLEDKYTQQIKDINDKHNNLYTEVFNNSKNLEKENKNLKLELEIKAKSFDPSQANKTIEDLTEQLDKLKSELDVAKKSSLTKNNEIRNQMEKEKDALKSKLLDLENRMKEVEAKRANGLFEIELERGKWQNEKEHLLNSITELKEQVETLQNKNENLTKDNIKLKNEKNNLNKGKVIGNSRITSGTSGIGRGMGNPYSNIVSGFGAKIGGLDKILDADTSGFGNSSMLSNNNNVKTDFSSQNKFSKYKGNNDIDDLDFNDK